MICQRFKFKENVNLKKYKESKKNDDDNLNSSEDSVSELFGDKEKEEFDIDELAKINIELKKELLAKYLVKEKEIISKMQKLLKNDKN